MKIALQSASSFYPAASPSTYKIRLRLIHVLLLQPLAAGAIAKLDHCMPMNLTEMALYQNYIIEVAWPESLALSWFPDSLPSLDLSRH